MKHASSKFRLSLSIASAALCFAMASSSVLAQTAISPFNNQRSVHNACWQALGIPPSRDYPTNPRHQRDLEACKAAGGPDAYLRGRRVAVPTGGTCSQYRQECVSANSALGVDTTRCSTYHQACLRSGVWEDRRRRITGVARR